MNILVFSWRDPKHPLAGGAEQVMHEHMKEWVEAGHEVTLFSSRFGGSAKSEVLDDVEIVRGGYQYLGVQWAGFLYYLKNKNKYDFVVDQFHGLPFFTPLYTRKPKLAVIQETARNVWFLNPLPRPLNWLVGIIGYLGEPFIFFLYRSTPFMTGSNSAKEDVSKFGIPKGNITVVSHGVIVKRPTPFLEKEKKPTIIYLGVLSKDKGIEDAVRCFAILDQRGNYSTKGEPHSTWQFWVIGRPETEAYGRKIINLVKSLGLENKVKFWGFVSQEKKFELLAKGHVLVNPSVHEGWGLVNIEANSVGTPVVAYRSPGLVDSIKDSVSGVFSKSNTPVALANAVVTLLEDKGRYLKISETSKKWSKNCSWERSVKLSLSLVRSVAG